MHSEAETAAAASETDAKSITFHQLLMTKPVKDMIKSKFKNPKFRFSEDAWRGIAEYLDLFTKEITLRAMGLACQENSLLVEFDHIERVLATILLDF